MFHSAKFHHVSLTGSEIQFCGVLIIYFPPILGRRTCQILQHCSIDIQRDVIFLLG